MTSLKFLCRRHGGHDDLGFEVYSEGPQAQEPAALAEEAQHRVGAPAAARWRVWESVQYGTCRSGILT